LSGSGGGVELSECHFLGSSRSRESSVKNAEVVVELTNEEGLVRDTTSDVVVQHPRVVLGDDVRR
jgi:hypothetical protein